MRKKILINDNWKFTKDSVLTSVPVGEDINLPHTWNARDGQDGGNDYWRGEAKYSRLLNSNDIKLPSHSRLYLEFAGASMSAKVYLNGSMITEHEGGYSTFRTDITDLIKEGDNLIDVLVDNSENDKVYPQRADFTFYGGIYRDVMLVIVDNNHFDMDYFGSNGIKISSSTDGQGADIRCEAWVVGGDMVSFTLLSDDKDRINISVPVKDGYAKADIHIENVHLWDGLNDPFLYHVVADLEKNNVITDTVETSIGIRSCYNDPEKGFILNGKEYPLRGVSRHQDRLSVGNAITYDMMLEDIDLILEMGANTIRLAHYQHCQQFYELCDEKGIIVWAEIPYITNHMDGGYNNTISQMSELIAQCFHHPSIVCWGLSNEITVGSKINKQLIDNHKDLNDLAHKMDPSRFTTIAHAFMLDIDEDFVRLADVCSYNLYYGWYLGELEENEAFFDKYHAKYPQDIIGFSEYGADANPAFHSSTPQRSDYTEEYQCIYHEHILNCINNRPYLWSTYVWNMFDFAADGRDEGGKNGQNQKGLVTFDRKTKKDAYYLYKASWNKTDSFVHICGSRYVDRCEDKTTVKVYSNLPYITLYVDGKEYDTKEGSTVFNFEVPISGEHTIEAKSDSYCDKIAIRKVNEPNPSYHLSGKSTVINWFDKDELNPMCYSIKDTMGELKKNPASNAILSKMMEKMTAARGDVAKTATENKGLQKMLEKMTIESLLKQAGDAVPEDMVRSLNKALQKIPK